MAKTSAHDDQLLILKVKRFVRSYQIKLQSLDIQSLTV